MFKKKNQNNENVVEIDCQKCFKIYLSEEELQTSFNDDKKIYEDAENIEEVDSDENENDETEK